MTISMPRILRLKEWTFLRSTVTLAPIAWIHVAL